MDNPFLTLKPKIPWENPSKQGLNIRDGQRLNMFATTRSISVYARCEVNRPKDKENIV